MATGSQLSKLGKNHNFYKDWWYENKSVTIDQTVNPDGSLSYGTEDLTYWELPRIVLECMTLDLAGKTKEANELFDACKDYTELIDKKSIDNFLKATGEINMGDSTSYRLKLSESHSPAALSAEEITEVTKNCQSEKEENEVKAAAQVEKVITMAQEAATRRVAKIFGYKGDLDNLPEDWRVLVEVRNTSVRLLAFSTIPCDRHCD